jgi:hypothetical protein
MLEAFNSLGFYEIESSPSLSVNRPERRPATEPQTSATTAKARSSRFSSPKNLQAS